MFKLGQWLRANLAFVTVLSCAIFSVMLVTMVGLAYSPTPKPSVQIEYSKVPTPVTVTTDSLPIAAQTTPVTVQIATAEATIPDSRIGTVCYIWSESEPYVQYIDVWDYVSNMDTWEHMMDTCQGDDCMRGFVFMEKHGKYATRNMKVIITESGPNWFAIRSAKDGVWKIRTDNCHAKPTKKT